MVLALGAAARTRLQPVVLQPGFHLRRQGEPDVTVGRTVAAPGQALDRPAQAIQTETCMSREPIGGEELELRPAAFGPGVVSRRATERVDVAPRKHLASHADAIAAEGEVERAGPALADPAGAPLAPEVS